MLPQPVSSPPVCRHCGAKIPSAEVAAFGGTFCENCYIDRSPITPYKGLLANTPTCNVGDTTKHRRVDGEIKPLDASSKFDRLWDDEE